MAFLAVMREGLETAMFLLAAFQASIGVSPLSAGLGAVCGVLVAVAIGWGIYSGGMRINLQRFFRITSVLLVIIAAGLLAGAVHHANEAALFTAGHEQALDLSAVVVPRSDSITTGLITGLLGDLPLPVGRRGRRLAAVRDPDARVRPLAAAAPGRASGPSSTLHPGALMKTPTLAAGALLAVLALAACGGNDDSSSGAKHDERERQGRARS